MRANAAYAKHTRTAHAHPPTRTRVAFWHRENACVGLVVCYSDFVGYICVGLFRDIQDLHVYRQGLLVYTDGRCSLSAVSRALDVSRAPSMGMYIYLRTVYVHVYLCTDEYFFM